VKVVFKIFEVGVEFRAVGVAHLGRIGLDRALVLETIEERRSVAGELQLVSVQDLEHAEIVAAPRDVLERVEGMWVEIEEQCRGSLFCTGCS
jgi:ferredoxin